VILRTLAITNFRQFRGRQELTFASEEDTPGKNITVLFGENGRGKTGIFRALVFCLFGERQLTQDGDAPEEELNLVNKHELEARFQEGAAAEAAVELAFADRGHRYTLKRVIRAMLIRGKVTEELREVRLTVQKPDGNTQVVVDPKDIASHVSAILDHRVSEYFLFDGERIERLTRADVQQRREVAKGIRNLLNIDCLEAAIDATQGVCRKLDQEIRTKSTGEHAQVIKQLTDNEEKQNDIKERLEQLVAELEHAHEEKRKVDKELKKYEGITALLAERTTLETDLVSAQKAIDDCLAKMRGRTGPTATHLIAATVTKVYTYINERKNRGEIPPEIRSELIDRILSEGTCICGRQVTPGTTAHEHIQEWKNKSGGPGVGDSALELWRGLSIVTGRLEDMRQAADTSLHVFAEAKHAVRKISARLDELSSQIGTSVRQDASKLEKHRRNIEDKVVSLKAEEQRLENDLSLLAAESDRLRAKRKQLEKDKSLRNDLIARAELASQLRDSLKAVFNEFKQDVRERLAKAATGLLHRLLDEEGQRSLSKIVVKDDYSLQIIDRWNGQFLANISAGQRQIMSISFIAALAQAASGGKVVEMPLFMDTPFGRLSLEHRSRLIREIPEICAQWVLLATDTELSQAEAELLMSGHRWGRFYVLRALNDGSTAIEERATKGALSLLRKHLEAVI
jgi:DNA sulfur modification protein DndD